MSTLQAGNIYIYISFGTRSRVARRGGCNRVPRAHLSVAFATYVVQQSRLQYILYVVGGRMHRQFCLHGRCGLRDAFVGLCKSETIEDHVLYHATVVSRCTSKGMSLPAAVLRDVLWVTTLSKI